MKSFKITNISGGQIVASLKDPKESFRLNNKCSTVLTEGQMTSHIENLINKGLLVSDEVVKTAKKQ